MPDIGYPGQHVDIKIPQGSGDRVIVPYTLKITLNLDMKSTDKARSVVNNVGRHWWKKGPHAWFNTHWHDWQYRCLWHIQGSLPKRKGKGRKTASRYTYPASDLKPRLGAKKADGTALTVTNQENAIKTTVDKRFAIPLDFDFFRHPVYIYTDLKKIWSLGLS